MRISGLLIAALGAVGFSGILSAGTPSHAQTPTQAELVAEAERECERALELNTIEALEAFLEKYRHLNTACLALALEALSQFEPGAPNDDPGDTGVYGA